MSFIIGVAVDCDELWEKTGSDEDPSSRLLGGLSINGINHHLEAIAVEETNHLQHVADPTFEEEYDGMCAVSGPDGKFQTVIINDRKYVLVMTPYC